MRGPTPEQILEQRPPHLRKNKTNDAHQALRELILTGSYQANHIINPKDIETQYGVNNTSVQILLLRLAIEGLIKIHPLRDKTGPNNAAYNEYRVADLNIRHRIFSTRHGVFVSDISRESSSASLESAKLDIQPADLEIASFFSIDVEENILFQRSIQRSDPDTIIAIADTYFPFWLVEYWSELSKPDMDAYHLMKRKGKNPFWCTETVDIAQASSVEREAFGLSADDTSALFKITRKVYDRDGTPLLIDFLTDRGDKYRLHYSFPLYEEDIPIQVRGK